MNFDPLPPSLLAEALALSYRKQRQDVDRGMEAVLNFTSWPLIIIYSTIIVISSLRT